VNTKAERRTARERVAAYHESCLTDLVAHVAEALEKLRTGEVDVYDVDETIHQYHRATQELWKFCWGGGSGNHIDLVDRVIQQNQTEEQATEWWERGAARRR
jgi:hypothetical protein